MNIKYTAYLASLLMAYPLASPSVSEASYWTYKDSTAGSRTWYYDFKEGSGEITCSNNEVTSLPDGYVAPSSVVIGAAYNTSDFATSVNDNSFTYNGGKFNSITCGYAVFWREGDVRNNKIILTDVEADSVSCGVIESFNVESGWETLDNNTIELNGGIYGNIEDNVPSGNIGPWLYGGFKSHESVENNSIIIRGGTYNVSTISTCIFSSTHTEASVMPSSESSYPFRGWRWQPVFKPAPSPDATI